MAHNPPLYARQGQHIECGHVAVPLVFHLRLAHLQVKRQLHVYSVQYAYSRRTATCFKQESSNLLQTWPRQATCRRPKKAVHTGWWYRPSRVCHPCAANSSETGFNQIEPVCLLEEAGCKFDRWFYTVTVTLRGVSFTSCSVT